MIVELRMLGWSIALGLTYVLLAAVLATRQRGLKWNTSNRDGQYPPLTGAAARAERASKNYLETFGFFAAAVLGVALAKTNTPHTALGAEIYLWARLAYLPIYIIGIPYLRSLVWAASFLGLLQILYALF